MMMSYNYPTNLNGSTSKPLDIYRGTEMIGTVRGYYNSVFVKYAEEFLNNDRPYFLKYEIKDHDGNVRLHAEMASFWKNEIMVNYENNCENKVDILMKNMKNARFGPKKVEFTYRGADSYILKRESIKAAFSLDPNPAEMFIDEKVIADWKIHVFDKRVVVRILDNDYIEDEYLILGLFHVFLYATKG